MQTIDLSSRPRNRDDLAAWYAAAFDDQAASGLSVAEYADLIGVTATTLYQWRRRLAAASHSEPEVSNVTGLVEVEFEETGATASEAILVVRLRDGIEIEVPSNFDDEALRRLIKVIDPC
ncbi:MAG: hypothetical protein GY722_04390 [bacterium]|nr:hypothetical protein [bacterium]